MRFYFSPNQQKHGYWFVRFLSEYSGILFCLHVGDRMCRFLPIMSILRTMLSFGEGGGGKKLKKVGKLFRAEKQVFTQKLDMSEKFKSNLYNKRHSASSYKSRVKFP